MKYNKKKEISIKYKKGIIYMSKRYKCTVNRTLLTRAYVCFEVILNYKLFGLS